MSLSHAILGFLTYQPFTGYDLKRVFDDSVRHFWPADQSQIYRTLSRLEGSGLAEATVVAQDSRPNRKVFAITDKGRVELRRWLTTEAPQEESRSASLIQVFFAGQLADEEILAIFERAASSLRETLGTLEGIPDSIDAYRSMARLEPDREGFFWTLTLECGIAMHRAQLRWVESVIDRIKKKQHPGSRRKRQQ